MTVPDLPDEVARVAELLSQVKAQFQASPPRIDTAHWAMQHRHIVTAHGNCDDKVPQTCAAIGSRHQTKGKATPVRA